MKKIASFIISMALLLAAGAWAEESSGPDAPNWLALDDLFRLEIPAHWQNYALTESQAESGMIACYGDGAHYLFVGRADAEEVADADALEAALIADENNVAPFRQAFGGADFICYADDANNSSNCATLIPGAGVYTFYFYPADGDEEFAQTIIDLMNSYQPLHGEMEAENESL